MDIFNICFILAIFFSGALVFFLGFICANKITIKDNNDIVVEMPKISKKEIKSSLKVKTKKEEQEEDKEHTVFFG